MNAWQQELRRCKVQDLFTEIDIYWVEDTDYHQHIDVFGLSNSSVKQIGDTYCHGFYLWACGCGNHDEPEIVAGWCQTPRHAENIIAGTMNDGETRIIERVMVTRMRKPHPKLNTEAVCYQLRVPSDLSFEVYDKPNNVGMVIIRPTAKA